MIQLFLIVERMLIAKTLTDLIPVLVWPVMKAMAEHVLILMNVWRKMTALKTQTVLTG